MATGTRLPAAVWLLFGLNGRAARGVYWLAYALITCVQSAIIVQLFAPEEASYYRLATTVGPVLLLATLYTHFAISVKRLHDCGYTGFIAAALLVPLFNVAFTIWVGILPGTPGPNRFGPAPNVQPV